MPSAQVIPPDIASKRAARQYLAAVAAVFLAALFIFSGAILPWNGGAVPDYFSQVARASVPEWYRDFGGRHIPQILDQDIFYSKIGSSVDAVKASDIVFMGPSFVNYAIDRGTLRTDPVLSRLKIYNMGFVGIRGGEFSRRVINRWHIRVPLWVINVDDQFVHFFSDDLYLTIGPEKTPIEAVGRDRYRSFRTVIGRSTRWRLEDVVAAWQTGSFAPNGLYRDVSNGDMSLESNPAYVAAGNKPMVSARDPNCPVKPEVVSYAKSFVQEMGGHVVFMLVPHSQACVQQAAELAQALNVEFIAPSFEGLTTVDGGGHLDKSGAEKFTARLAAELVKTEAFKQAFGGAGASRARP